MVVYSIKDIEKLTGVKAHTIRIWEKRYAIIEPKRTKTNIRYYDEQDLKLIMNIALLNANGYKISSIAKLKISERDHIAAHLNKVDVKFENQIDAITYSILKLDEKKINFILSQNVEQNGLKETMDTLVYPLLEKMGIMWVSGSISEVHERFVTNLLRNVIISEIQKFLEKYEDSKTKVLLYLPKGQAHELSLLYLHFLILQSGCEVTQLGTECTLAAVHEALNLKEVDYVVTIINETPTEAPVQKYLEVLSETILDKAIGMIIGYQLFANPITIPSNLKAIQNMDEIIDHCINKEKVKSQS